MVGLLHTQVQLSLLPRPTGDHEMNLIVVGKTRATLQRVDFVPSLTSSCRWLTHDKSRREPGWPPGGMPPELHL